MDFLKLGFNNILGVLAPGAILVGGMALGLICSLNFYEIEGYNRIFEKLLNAEIFLIINFLLLSYFIGSAIRLFAMDVVEILSGIYLRILMSIGLFPKDKKRLAKERFPYPLVATWIKEKINTKVITFLENENPQFADQHNKDFYNYCKMYIREKSLSRSIYCERIESYARFLAGSFIAGAITLLICLYFMTLFYLKKDFLFSTFLLWISIYLVISNLAILARFRNQHTREVMHTWLAYYDCKIESEKSEQK